jgi:hypothetical protein
MLPIAAAAALISAILFGFVGLVAWTDYQNLHCPGAYQCSDAVSMMWVAGIMSPFSILLVIGIIRFMRKRSQWRAGRRP